MTATIKSVIQICRQHNKIKKFGCWLKIPDFLTDLRYHSYTSLIIQTECDECKKAKIPA